MVTLRTKRLILRRWRHSDREPFANLNRDPRAMEFLPTVLSPVESDVLIDRIEKHFRQHGFGLCAAELCETQSPIGFIGLSVPAFTASFTPCVEIGWRLLPSFWGQGLATEGAEEVVRHAFGVLGLESIVAFTVPANLRSLRVIEKLGMLRDSSSDFEHPQVPEGHPLRRHVLYRLRRSHWLARRPPSAA